MTYLVVLFGYRKEGMSPAEFQEWWDEKHVPFFMEITKPHTPIEYTRHYVARVDSGAGERVGATNVSPKNADAYTPVVLIGMPDEIPWDVMAEMKFRDELHFQQFFALINEPETAEKIASLEAQFTEPSRLKAVVIGQTVTTLAT